MSRAAHDAIGRVLNLESGCPFGNAASRLTRECAADKDAGQALAVAFAGVTAAGFSEEDTARALAAVAARRGARNSTSRAALDWLCLRLGYDDLPKAFREDDIEDRLKKKNSQGSLEVISRGAPEPEKEEPPSLLMLMGLKEDPLKPPPPPVPEGPPPEHERAPRGRKDSDDEALKQYALRAVERQEAEAKEAELRAQAAEQRRKAFDALPADQKRDHLEAALLELRLKHVALKKARAYDEMREVGEEIKGANEELRKLPERPKKIEEPRACAACGLDKPRGNFSKAQWTASSVSRRCLACCAAKRVVLKSRAGSVASSREARSRAGSVVSQASQAPTTVVDDDAAVGAMFEEAEACAAAAPPPVHKELVPRERSPPPVVWSGATPREKLEQWCRERGNPKPSYEVASRTTVRCKVWALSKERVQRKTMKLNKGSKPPPGTAPTVNLIADAEDPILRPWAKSRSCSGGPSKAPHDFAACVALYALAPDLPLYRVLPPPFKQWWMEKLDVIKKEREAEASLSAVEKQRRSDKIIADVVRQVLLHASSADDAAADAAEEQELLEQERKPVKVEVEPESWEDLLGDDDEEDTWEDHAPSTPVIEEREDEEDLRRLRDKGDDLRAWWLERKASPAYAAMRDERAALPAHGARESFIQLAGDATRDAHRDRVVVCGETGSGKTTQLPHYLMDAALCAGGERAARVRIVVTQPRRVAATSVATRVAQECGEHDVGGLVGYHIRHERRCSSKTKILFCTAGVLLRCLRGSKASRSDSDDGADFIRNATHIILDEIHERAADSDLLLAALRRTVAAQHRIAKARKLSLILMSATLDAQLFQKYLDAAVKGSDKGDFATPLVTISGRAHPVQNYFLEDVVAATGYVAAACGGGDRDVGRRDEGTESVRTVRRDDKTDAERLVDRAVDRYKAEEVDNGWNIHKLDYDLVVAAIEAVVEGCFPGPPSEASWEDQEDADDGAVLVFLPGVGEIRRLADRFVASRRLAHCLCVVLHANAPREDQKAAFARVPHGYQRKIVLATNVAESSVTIPDVTCVVDCGRVKEVRHHRHGSEKLFSACPTLETAWCSRASARQRAGRAGRVRPGVAVRLYTQDHFLTRLPQHQEPELQRVPLEELILSTKATCDEAKKNRDSEFFSCSSEWLQDCAQPPPKHALSAALSELVSVGALTYVDEEEQGWGAIEQALAAGSDEKLVLAPLGRHLARLPVHPRLGKILVYGTLLGCVGPVASVAAAVGSGGRPDAIWAPDPARSQREERKKLCPPRADLVAAGRALDAWRTARGGGRQLLAKKLGLHEPALRDALEARDHFVQVLERAGLLARGTADEERSHANRHACNANVIAAVLVGALAPHVARVDAVAKDGKSVNSSHTELSVPKIASAKASGEETSTFVQQKVRFDRARLTQSSMLDANDLDEKACHVAFFSRRWEAGRGRLLLGGCAVATPFALLLMYPGEVEVNHAKREATIARWIRLVKTPARTAVLLRELRRELNATLAELFERPPASSGISDHTTSAIDVVARLLAEEPTRAILGE